MHRRTKIGWSTIILFFTAILLQATVTPRAAFCEVAKVAILPFTMHTPEKLMYLQDGIRAMLSSRLAWEGKVAIVDSSRVDSALGSVKNVSQTEALQVGRKVGADYVIMGSLTALGQSLSIDSKMLSVDGSKKPVTMTAQTSSMDDVIPQVNNFAQNINANIFGRPGAASQVSSFSQESPNRNPEYLISQMAPQGGSISYLNPNFIELTPDGVVNRAGLWRSQTIKGGLVGMDIGDLDGDGIQELVCITKDKLIVYRRQAMALQQIATVEAGHVNRFAWVALADLNSDKRDEIYVTNLFTQNRPTVSAPEATTDQFSQKAVVASMVFTLENQKLRRICERQPYYLNTILLGTKRKVLAGQRHSDFNQLFDDNIYEMTLKGNQLKPGAPIHVPKFCDVYNFAKADINDDHSEELIIISKDNRLRIYDQTGNQLWRSRKRFGATTNYLVGKVSDKRYNLADYYYIPSPILVSDLNQDNIDEVIVNRSPDYSSLLPQGFKFYEAGSIVSLSWDQLGLVENWKTREIDGMITSVRLGDLNNDGTTELIVCYLMGPDLLQFWKTKSTVVSYDLNIAAAKKKAAGGQ